MNKKIILNVPEKHLPIEPLTKKELHDTAVERVHLISREFTDGFNFLSKYPKSVTIFGGTRFKETDPEYEKANSLAKKISSELKYTIFTGGGPGIMEAANRGAKDAGGGSIGVTIELERHQVRNQYLTDHISFHYFFSRKVCLAFSAEAYIFFPGGFGTLDEFFEIITLVQTKKIERVPIVLVGSEYWNALETFMRKELLNRSTVDEDDLNLFTITDDEDQIVEIIKNAPIHVGVRFTHKNLEKSGIVVEN